MFKVLSFLSVALSLSLSPLSAKIDDNNRRTAPKAKAHKPVSPNKQQEAAKKAAAAKAKKEAEARAKAKKAAAAKAKKEAEARAKAKKAAAAKAKKEAAARAKAKKIADAKAKKEAAARAKAKKIADAKAKKEAAARAKAKKIADEKAKKEAEAAAAIAKAKADAETRRVAEAQRKAAEVRAAQEKADADARKLAEEQKRAAEERAAQERAAAEWRRMVEEKREARAARERANAEARRIAEEQRRVAEARAAQERAAAEARRIAEEQRRVAEARAAQERADAEARRIAEEQRRVAEEQRRAVEARAAILAQDEAERKSEGVRIDAARKARKGPVATQVKINDGIKALFKASTSSTTPEDLKQALTQFAAIVQTDQRFPNYAKVITDFSKLNSDIIHRDIDDFNKQTIYYFQAMHDAEDCKLAGPNYENLSSKRERSAKKIMVQLINFVAELEKEHKRIPRISDNKHLSSLTEEQLRSLLREISEGGAEVMTRAFLNGFTPDKPLDNSWTPLMYAARESSPQTIKVLLGAGASPCESNLMGWTPLHFAAYWGKPENVKALLEYPYHGGSRIDLNARISGLMQQTALEMAQAKLTEAKAANNLGYNPTYAAIIDAYTKIVECLQ